MKSFKRPYIFPTTKARQHKNSKNRKKFTTSYILTYSIILLIAITITILIIYNRQDTMKTHLKNNQNNIFNSLKISSNRTLSTQEVTSAFKYFTTIIENVEHKFCSSKYIYINVMAYDLMKNTIPTLKRLIKQIKRECIYLYTKIHMNNTPVKNINKLYKGLFNYLKILYLIHSYTFNSIKEDSFNTNDLSTQKINNIKFVFQRLILLKVHYVMKELIDSFKEEIINVIIKQINVLHITKSSKVYNTMNKIRELFENNLNVIFNAGHFNITFKDRYTKKIQHLLSSISNLDKFIKLNIYILYFFLFKYDESGKIICFTNEAYEIVKELIEEKNGYNNYLIELDETNKKIINKCRNVIKKLDDCKEFKEESYFFDNFDYFNRDCLNSLSSLWKIE